MFTMHRYLMYSPHAMLYASKLVLLCLPQKEYFICPKLPNCTIQFHQRNGVFLNCKIGHPWLGTVAKKFAWDSCLILKAAKKSERIGLEHFLISQGHLRLLNSAHRLVVPKTEKALSECRLAWLMLLEDLLRAMKSRAFSMTPTANFTLWFVVLRLVRPGNKLSVKD